MMPKPRGRCKGSTGVAFSKAEDESPEEAQWPKRARGASKRVTEAAVAKPSAKRRHGSCVPHGPSTKAVAAEQEPAGGDMGSIIVLDGADGSGGEPQAANRSRAGRVRMPPLAYWANERTVRDRQGHVVAIQRPWGSAQLPAGRQKGQAQALPGKQQGKAGSSAGKQASKVPGKAADVGRKPATRGAKSSMAPAGSRAHADSSAQQEGSEAAADCRGEAQQESDSLCTLPAWGLRQQRSRASPAKPGAEGPTPATRQAGSQGGRTKVLLGKRKCPEPPADTDSNASSEGNELPDSVRAASRPGAEPGPGAHRPPVAAAGWQHATAQAEASTHPPEAGSRWYAAAGRGTGQQGPGAAPVAPPDAAGWTQVQLDCLQNAYKLQVPPGQRNFWLEVAKLVPGKTWKECCDKIFDLQPTPEGSKQLPPKRYLKAAGAAPSQLAPPPPKVVGGKLKKPSAAAKRQWMRDMRWQQAGSALAEEASSTPEAEPTTGKRKRPVHELLLSPMLRQAAGDRIIKRHMAKFGMPKARPPPSAAKGLQRIDKKKQQKQHMQILAQDVASALATQKRMAASSEDDSSDPDQYWSSSDSE